MRWLVVDGIDGSGKNTLAHVLKEWYDEKGHEALIMQHPSDRLSGRISRRSLQSEGRIMRTFASVFYILDVLISVSRLRRLRKTDKTVIFVRYLMGTAYLPERFVEFGYDFFAKILPLTRSMMLIDIQPEIASKRIRSREDTKEMFEDLESLRKARSKVIKLSSKGWTVIENSGDIEVSKKALLDAVERWEAEGATLYPR
ncbi:MAG: thymidylate kinase [Euryarchaeota archaeon]|nr:thymidylate kinase [Euryarchaeota archaeon]